ncbi:hypothetical protein SESBI_39545 [Sesbania bispinosa]|nr:hypothetical protein SESBI_39545 [Sesbania bispinosa]
MAVVVPSPTGSPTSDHFDFNGAARFSPYLSAPSSPKRFGEFYLSAPTSPSRFYTEFDYFSASPSNLYDWERKPAEELFHGGKIKPLKEEELLESSRSPLLSPNQPRIRSPIRQGKKAILEAFSPRKKKESQVSHYTWEEESQQSNKEDSVPVPVPTEPSLSSTSSKSSRKWRLRDFLLFRSASEGRGSSKDPFRKYSVLYKKPEEVKGSTVRSSDNTRSRRKEQVSAHELHYARKKAETEDLKKRTFLPYKQGILGRWAGFGSLTR